MIQEPDNQLTFDFHKDLAFAPEVANNTSVKNDLWKEGYEEGCRVGFKQGLKEGQASLLSVADEANCLMRDVVERGWKNEKDAGLSPKF